MQPATSPSRRATATSIAATTSRAFMRLDSAWVRRVLVGLGLSGRVGLPEGTVVGGFDLGGCGVIEFAVDAFLVEPGDPAAGGDLEVVEAFPGASDLRGV